MRLKLLSLLTAGILALSALASAQTVTRNPYISGSGVAVGPVYVADGSCTAGSVPYSFTNDTDTGIWREGSGIIQACLNGVPVLGLNGDALGRQVKVHSGAVVGWTTGDSTGSVDTQWSRYASTIGGFKSISDPTSTRINIIGNSGNTEFLTLGWGHLAGSRAYIGTTQSGGTQRRLDIDASDLRFLIAGTEAASVSATDVRTTNFYTTSATGRIGSTSYGYITPYASADGQWSFLNNAGNVGVVMDWGNTDGTLHVKTRAGADTATVRASKFLARLDGGSASVQWQNAGTGSGASDGMLAGHTAADGVNFEFWNFENGFIRFATNNSTRWTMAASNGDLAPSSGVAYAVATRAIVNTAPTISSGFGTSPSVAANNGTFAFTINVGTGGTAQNGVIGLPTATTGWKVTCEDITTPASYIVGQTATTTTTATVQNYSRTTGLATAWTASDVLSCSAVAY